MFGPICCLFWVDQKGHTDLHDAKIVAAMVGIMTQNLSFLIGNRSQCIEDGTQKVQYLSCIILTCMQTPLITC